MRITIPKNREISGMTANLADAHGDYIPDSTRGRGKRAGKETGPAEGRTHLSSYRHCEEPAEQAEPAPSAARGSNLTRWRPTAPLLDVSSDT